MLNMKSSKAILLLLVFAACAFLVYKAMQPAHVSGPESVPSNAAQCNQSLWNYENSYPARSASVPEEGEALQHLPAGQY